MTAKHMVDRTPVDEALRALWRGDLTDTVFRAWLDGRVSPEEIDQMLDEYHEWESEI